MRFLKLVSSDCGSAIRTSNSRFKCRAHFFKVYFSFSSNCQNMAQLFSFFQILFQNNVEFDIEEFFQFAKKSMEILARNFCFQS